MSNGKPHSLRRCRQGSAVIEFAIVAPILFMLIAGMIEMSLVLLTNNALEAATGIGARIGKIGYVAKGLSREDYIREQIYRMSGGFLQPDRLDINILSYDNFGNIGTPEPYTDKDESGSYTTGEAFIDVNGNGVWDNDQAMVNAAGGNGSVVFYRVNYSWPLFTPLMGQIIGDSKGNINISAMATVRNEAFQ